MFIMLVLGSVRFFGEAMHRLRQFVFETIPALAARISGWQVLRIVLGLVLLTAALFKVHELSTTPYLDKFPPRWVMIVFTELEILFALWLFFVSERLTQITWLTTLGLFSFFACVTLYKALAGEASCGCFGRVEINPWYTLIFDSTVVGLLLWFRPRGKRFILREIRLPLHFLRSESGTASLLGVGIIWLIFCIPSAWSMVSFAETDTHDNLSALGQVFEGPDGKPVVVLEPEKWVGKKFPLLGRIKDSNVFLKDKISKGTWNVILVHRSCSKCQVLLERLRDINTGLPAYFDSNGRIAIIVLPEKGDTEQDMQETLGFHFDCNPIYFGSLKEDFVCFAQTPVMLVVNNRVVNSVID